jgi:carbon-monoxide dehydrogenase medium subunit
MYAPSFDYYRARSVADAHQLLAAHPGAKLLAGGHSLLPLLKLRLAAPPALVDIGRIPELRGISRQGDWIRIGALTTHAELAASADLQSGAPALADAAASVGDPAVRNRGRLAEISRTPTRPPICQPCWSRSTRAWLRPDRAANGRSMRTSSSPGS